MKTKIKDPLEMRRYFVSCDCHTEGLIVTTDMSDKQIYLSMWELGKHRNNTLDLKSRLRLIWHVIIKGNSWHDEIILNKKTAKDLGLYLLREVKRCEG